MPSSGTPRCCRLAPRGHGGGHSLGGREGGEQGGGGGAAAAARSAAGALPGYLRTTYPGTKFIGERMTSTTWKGKHIHFNQSPRTYKCSFCNQPGHNRRTCKVRIDQEISHRNAATIIQKYARRMICLRRIQTSLHIFEEFHKLPRDTATVDQVLCWGELPQCDSIVYPHESGDPGQYNGREIGVIPSKEIVIMSRL